MVVPGVREQEDQPIDTPVALLLGQAPLRFLRIARSGLSVDADPGMVK